MSFYVDCVNCGKQVSVELCDDICYWCHNLARVKVIKEVEVSEKIGQLKASENSEKLTRKKEADMSKKGGNLQAKHRFIEQNKAEIIADLVSLGKKAMLVKWEISDGGWTVIKRRWVADIEMAQKDAPAVSEVEQSAGTVHRVYHCRQKDADMPRNWEKDYYVLEARFDGYRQAVVDIFRQPGIEVKSKKD